MSNPAWYFPPAMIGGFPNTDARTQSIAPYGASMVAVGGYAPYAGSGATLFTFNIDSLTWGSLSAGLFSQVMSVYPDADEGLVAVGPGGSAAHYASGGSVLASGALASGAPFVSAVAIGASGFAGNFAGQLYSMNGTLFGTTAPAGDETRQVVNAGTELVTAINGADAFGLTSFAGAYTGDLPAPSGMSKITCLAPGASSGAFIAGGYTAAAQGASGQNFFSLNPANQTLLLGVSDSMATIFEQSGSIQNLWGAVTELSGITGSATSGIWSTNGTQALLSDPTNNALQILNYTAGTLSISQTISISGCGAIAAASDGASALMCMPSAGEVTVFRMSGSTWSQVTANTLAVSGACCIAPLGATMLVGGANGVSVLTENAGTWSVSETISTGFSVTALAVDAYGNAYAANATNIAVISGGAITGTGAIAGGESAACLTVFQSQVLVTDSTAGVLRVLGSVNGTTWGQQNQYAIAGVTCTYQAAGTIFVSRAAAPLIYAWTAPYEIAPVQSGIVSIYSGSAWSSFTPGIGQIPSAVAADPSGNYWAACNDNALYELSATAELTAQTEVPNYPGTSTPLGVSSLAFSNGHMFAGCSLFGGLIQVL